MRNPRLMLWTVVLASVVAAGATARERAAAQPGFDVAPRAVAPHEGGRRATDVPHIGVTSIDSVGMTVGDLDRSIAFYTTVLPFVVESDVEVSGRPWELLQGVFGARLRVVTLRLGDERLELTQYLAPRGRPMPLDSRGNDRWFQHVAIIVSDMDAAYARLREYAVAHASTGPQRLPDWNPGAAGIEAFYFRDPDGHFLEVLHFPPGKGQARWHQPGPPGRIFLGIDHTAIVVGSTEAALAFYRDTLGLEVVGTGLNHGVEQEHLNGVFGVRLRLTTLRGAQGAAIELLEYLAPRDGRPAPVDLKANDIAHWQITMRAPAIDALLEPSATYGLVSPDVADVGAYRVPFRRGLLVRDVDGHATRLVQ